jgi:integrase
VFTGKSWRILWCGKVNKLVKWPEAVAAIGAAGLHSHDLLHTGNSLASRAQGLRDIRARMGHDGPAQLSGALDRRPPPRHAHRAAPAGSGHRRRSLPSRLAPPLRLLRMLRIIRLR